ncbi:MAG: GatB/YqeY domain-containing protein [Alphaproteobacteria bacterium]
MLRDELKNAMKDALREKRTHELATIRLILAAVKDRDIAAREHGRMDGVDDDSIRDLLQKMIKQRGESISLYEQGGRLELAEAERAEIEVIKTFLPTQMSADQVETAVEAAIARIGATGIKDMGKLMAELRQKHGAALDVPTAAAIAKRRLGVG